MSAVVLSNSDQRVRSFIGYSKSVTVVCVFCRFSIFRGFGIFGVFHEPQRTVPGWWEACGGAGLGALDPDSGALFRPSPVTACGALGALEMGSGALKPRSGWLRATDGSAPATDCATTKPSPVLTHCALVVVFVSGELHARSSALGTTFTGRENPASVSAASKSVKVVCVVWRISDDGRRASPLRSTATAHGSC